MASPSRKRRAKKGTKIRVDMRRNRSKPRRLGDLTRRAKEAEGHEFDASRSENIVAKGDLSRRRTVLIRDGDDALPPGLRRGTVVAMRGLFADVDDGRQVWSCTVRRMLLTRLTDARHPVAVGDQVGFAPDESDGGEERQGVIEAVAPRSGQLRRRVGRRVHTIVANVDRAIIVSSAAEPPPKPNLIDRYIVASLAGDICPVICINKMDLDSEGVASKLLDRYTALGYQVLGTSVVSGAGIDDLRTALKDKTSVVAGQSGVGKSSLLNAVQPGLRLRTGDISTGIRKGRHTTSTATMLRLDFGGYVVDTPGVRSFDISAVARNEIEAYFVEFLDHIPHCAFADCTHTHEGDCAVKEAVECGHICPERYESYARLFEESRDHTA